MMYKVVSVRRDFLEVRSMGSKIVPKLQQNANMN